MMKSKLERLCFIHIPKTAGMSLYAALLNYFKDENSLRIGSEVERNVFLRTNPEEIRRYRFIAGHVSVEEILRKGVYYPIVSVLREPENRLISLQNYLSKSQLTEHQDFNFKNIENLYIDMLNNGQYNMQCWHLSGFQNIESAIRSIVYNQIYVVPIEYYQDLINTLSELMPVNLKNIKMNVTKYDKVKIDNTINNDLRDKVIGDDVKLYNYVLENYEYIKRSFLSSLIR